MINTMVESHPKIYTHRKEVGQRGEEGREG
jgi:hypothetical protein